MGSRTWGTLETIVPYVKLYRSEGRAEMKRFSVVISYVIIKAAFSFSLQNCRSPTLHFMPRARHLLLIQSIPQILTVCTSGFDQIKNICWEGPELKCHPAFFLGAAEDLHIKGVSLWSFKHRTISCSLSWWVLRCVRTERDCRASM